MCGSRRGMCMLVGILFGLVVSGEGSRKGKRGGGSEAEWGGKQRQERKKEKKKRRTRGKNSTFSSCACSAVAVVGVPCVVDVRC